MQSINGSLAGVRGSRIYTQRWLPEGAPKAALLVVHGLGEHSGRYQNVVNHFVPLGYAVYALDHLGHGQSAGQREFVERFEDYTDTLKLYFGQVQAEHPGLPVYIVGHSLGGLISTFYLLDHQAELAGAVLSAPAVKMPASVTPLLRLVSRVMSAVAPRAGVAALEAPDISRDPAVVQAYVNDPLVFTGKTTARLAAESLKAMQRVKAGAATITLPLLIVQGGDDHLVDPIGARELYDSVGSTDKTLKIYPGLYHEIFNEPERGQVLSDVESWLAAHAQV